MSLPPVQCGHFALSTLSETWLKEPVVEKNVKKNNHPQFKNPKMLNLTPTSNILSLLDIILSSLTHFDIALYNVNAIVLQC